MNQDLDNPQPSRILVPDGFAKEFKTPVLSAVTRQTYPSPDEFDDGRFNYNVDFFEAHCIHLETLDHDELVSRYATDAW